MVQVATALMAQRELTGQTALEILDIACLPWRNTDAEFDEENMPDRPFGQLIMEAFADGQEFRSDYVYTLDNEDGDDFYDWWSEHPGRKFRERYGLY